MNMNEYLDLSARTAAGKLHDDVVTPAMLAVALEDLSHAARVVDMAKKGLFYGKPGDALDAFRDMTMLHDDYPDVQKFNEADRDTIHAIVGMITEAAELGEVLLDHLLDQDEEPLHIRAPKKLVDEAGDSLWYSAMLFRQLGTTFEEAGEKNIQKLTVRFPEKFTEDLAVNRNEASEKAVF